MYPDFSSGEVKRIAGLNFLPSTAIAFQKNKIQKTKELSYFQKKE